METNYYWVVLGVGAVVAAYLLLRLVRICEAANEADWGSPWLNRLDGLNRLFCRYYHGLKYDPIRLSEAGGAIVVANHVSGLDPLLMIAASKRPLRFMIAREQYQRFGLTWLFRAVGCIPVDRSERPELALRAALRALHAGEVVALFPHGRIHLDSDPPRKLKAGAVRLALKTGCLIFPVRVDGVRGQGLTVLAVSIPSRARLRTFPPLRCEGLDVQPCLETLAQLLNGER